MICEPHWFLNYKETNVVHEKKVENPISKRDNMCGLWNKTFTLNKIQLNHFLFEYFYENSVGGNAD